MKRDPYSLHKLPSISLCIFRELMWVKANVICYTNNKNIQLLSNSYLCSSLGLDNLLQGHLKKVILSSTVRYSYQYFLVRSSKVSEIRNDTMKHIYFMN